MLELKAMNIRQHPVVTSVDPFKSLNLMPGAMEPRTPFPSSEGIPFDAEILYARKAAENNRHPEISRLETKFNKTIVGYLYRTQRGSVALQCDTDGHKSVLQTGISFEALLTLPNLRESCKVTPIPDTTQFEVSDTGKNIGYIVTPDENMCGCQLIFNHEYECRHLKAVYEYQAENTVSFQKKTPSDYPKVENTPETPVAESEMKTEDKPTDNASEVPSSTPADAMTEMVAKHHPDSLAALEINGKQESVYCALCSRELTNPTSLRAQLGPVCREKVGMKGEAHIRENVVSEKLLCASRKYKDAKFQNWILHGCLQLDAPVPETVIPQKKTEYWGLKRAPSLYYLCKSQKLHCVYKVGKEFKYQRITATSRENELNQMAWREAKEEYIENGGKKRRTILL